MPIKLVRAELTDNTLSSTKLIGRIIRNHINYTSTITQNTKQHAVYLCIQVPVSRLDRQNCQQQRRKKNIQSHIWISFVVRGVLIRLGKAISTLRTRFAFFIVLRQLRNSNSNREQQEQYLHMSYYLDNSMQVLKFLQLNLGTLIQLYSYKYIASYYMKQLYLERLLLKEHTYLLYNSY
ncbi:hypothetical protein SS50377_21307 [Spironucleus salmonicida]|uniref:Uncharacterized protein n=1 Tax=Spironucleus salmonicida TaxID=348837 RepID=A0A9P8LWU9_9EUKA|nr:hypothetical protein SS50377_21307 [Spironucleus salmonicida]